MAASPLRGNYTISKKAKENTDFLRKNYKLNISELVSGLLEFNADSISKIFEIYKKINSETIEKNNRLDTENGMFVWDENIKQSVNKIPLHLLDSSMSSFLAFEVKQLTKVQPTLSEKEFNKRFTDMIMSQNSAIKAIENLINANESFEKRIKELEDKLAKN